MSADVLHAHGTVVSDPASTLGALANPGNANDANDATAAIVTGSVVGAGTRFRGAKATLTAAYSIDAIRLKSQDNKSSADYFYYSTDGGSTWLGGVAGSVDFPGSWNGTSTDQVFTPSVAIAAADWRYDRYDIATGLHFAAELKIWTWELRGTAPAPAVPVVDFTGTPLTGSAPLGVAFTDHSTNTPTSWAWTFGDGGTSTSKNPSHTYAAAGTYNVTLAATNAGGTGTLTKFQYVTAARATTAGVFADWDGDGFGTGDHDDITSNVMSWDISRGAGAQVTEGADPGSMTLLLKNPDDIYNPRNALSPLYGALRDGVPIFVAIADDGTFTGSGVNGLFGGRITDITPIPAGGADESPTVEIVCEDMLGWARRTPVFLDYAEGRSHAALRQAVLTAAGETHSSLAREIQTMPLSHADGDLLAVLDALNAVTGTRHLCKPGTTFDDWYVYTTRNRFWRTDATVDASLDAGTDHVTGTNGWRLSADTVTNEQRATVQPIIFTPGTFTVWEADALPFSLTSRNPLTLWVDFDDVVTDAVLDIASTGASVVSTLTPFATTAKIELTVASGTAVISALSIEGRLARRPPTEGYVADDTTSQAAPRGVRAGTEISGEYLGVLAEARGIAEHIVWRYPDPQLRPSAVVENWFPEMFQLDLYDTIAFTSDQLAQTAHLFEIVGLRHEGRLAATTAQHHVVTYQLQEARVQSDPGWFELDDPGSLLDGPKLLRY